MIDYLGILIKKYGGILIAGVAVTINVNAQMMITMLNSASPSELSTIKSILGI